MHLGGAHEAEKLEELEQAEEFGEPEDGVIGASGGHHPMEREGFEIPQVCSSCIGLQDL